MEPMYNMHGPQAPGFYGPSMTFPAPVPIVFGASPPVMGVYTDSVPMQQYTTDAPKERAIPIHSPQVVYPVLDDNSPSHRALLWGGLLAFFSTATFVNGMIRFLQSWPTVLIDGGSLTEDRAYFPPIVALIAGIFAIVIGLTGFVTGLSSILHNAIKPATAMAAAGFIALLASYVFTIEVFVVPIFDFTKMVDIQAPTAPNNINQVDRNALITFSSVFCWFSFFVTSVGMIILCCLELKSALSGALETLKGAQMKQRIMSLAVFFYGVAVLVLGCIIYQDEGSERLIDRAYVFYPNFVAFPSIMVISAMFLWCYAAPGIIATPAMAKIQGWLAIPMFLWMVSCHWLLELSHFGRGAAVWGGWAGILCLMNIAAPAVYGGRVAKLAKYHQ